MSKPKLNVVENPVSHETKMRELVERSAQRAQELRDAEPPLGEGTNTMAAALALMDVPQNWFKRWRLGKPGGKGPTYDDFAREL